MTASYRFVVTGHVQGVGFRQTTCRQAIALKLRGWVRNRADGAVEGWVCGGSDTLDVFQQWLRTGPIGARVDRLDWIKVNPDEAPDQDSDKSADQGHDQPAGPGFRIER